MCFNCIDIFTQSLWHMNKHQLQKAKSVGHKCTQQKRPGTLPIQLKTSMENTSPFSQNLNQPSFIFPNLQFEFLNVPLLYWRN